MAHLPGHWSCPSFVLSPSVAPAPPANWGRVTRLIQWVLFTYFGIYMPIYVDDCFLVEPAETVHSAFECANALNSMCGFEMGKFTHPAESVVLLGDEILIRPNFASASLPGDKRDALIEDITVIIKSGHLAPGHAAKLRGLLGFAQSLLF